ncbi:apolipoprotein C-II-like [Neopsephotus bourkii]|uniref:apolipoprotein C-II-like n=1 Tax=Neopsephotus bourkii TaxID=309878 RepID=UPI002AA554E9|nr:apolipoprotein C-II-like [Neopsephotus bourkii]
MASLPPPMVVASLLLLLSSTSSSAPPPTRPPPSPLLPLPHFREYLGSVTGNLLEHLDLPRTHSKIRAVYEQGTAAMLTYTGILTDQLYHWWQGEE